MKTALDVALTYLSRRALTHFELVQRLVQKDYSSEEIDHAIERLTEWGYLNDREYAIAYCSTKQKSYSKNRIELELKRRGIEDGLISQVLAEFYLPIQEYELCKGQAQRIWQDEAKRWESTYQHKKSYAKIPRALFLRQKLGQKLVQKGYSIEMIHSIIEELTGRD
jgi:regulatory protein